MTDGEGLLQAILAEPAENSVRLVYADWLDENGQGERAGYIRLTVEIDSDSRDRCPISGNKYVLCQPEVGCGYCDLRLRCNKMYEPFLREAESALNPYGCRNVTPPHRGFVDRIELPCAEFMQHAGEIFRRHPVVSVRLADREPAHGGRTTAEYYGWWRNNHPGWNDEQSTGHGDLIPYAIWELLEGDIKAAKRVSWKMYETDTDAHTALSRAAVAYGRNLVGLPPLAKLAAAS